jgi:transketolase
MQNANEKPSGGDPARIVSRLRQLALAIKRDIVLLAARAGEGHCAPALSFADIAAVLYGHTLRHDSRNPNWDERDRFILSKGHGCLGLYCALYRTGYFGEDTLNRFLQPGIGLGGHPVQGTAPGIEASTGSLGHGMSMAVGLAMAGKMDRRPWRVFTLVGDGESNEGMVWEAAACAAHYKLDNLVCILDRNGYQCDGFAKNVLDMEPMAHKWRAFGWAVAECDGHDVDSLMQTMDRIPFETDKPSLVLARTVKGKGVSFMESNADWHYRAPNEEELERALTELEAGSKDWKQEAKNRDNPLIGRHG